VLITLSPERNEAIEETNLMYSPPLPSKIIHTHDWNIDESAIALMSIEQCCRYIMTRTIYLFMHYLFTSSL
jgi:hypothetical protein